PGTNFQNTPVNIQAGVAVWEDGHYELRVAPNLGSEYTDGQTWTGFNGPQDNGREISNTGFYLRKMVSEASGASLRGNSENWWPWFRLGEIYLNAAEAAFELGEANAADY